MSRERHSHAPEGGPVASFLQDAGRDRIPGSLPVISFREEDEHAFLDDLERSAGVTVELSRRGRFHGQWAELLPEASGVDLPAEFADLGALKLRWHSARPIVLPGILRDALDDASTEIVEAFDLYQELSADGGLRRWLKARIDQLGPEWRVRDKRTELPDPERDLEKVLITRNSEHRALNDLWWKSGHLSTVESDASLRLRVSFGSEVDDDASRDLVRHRAVTEMAEGLLPGAALIAEEESLTRMLEMLSGQELFSTQHIGYWNAPEGGALFHHDAFEETADGGQQGVVYAQLSGRTAWLALSSADLALRVREFMQLLEQGELDWVRTELFPSKTDLQGALDCASDDERIARELALPGCGRFAGLVNLGPEFTDYLTNAGHAFLMDAGDVLLMPNFGLKRTVMHSVFCADDEPTYAISSALRSVHEDLETAPFDEPTLLNEEGATNSPPDGNWQRNRGKRDANGHKPQRPPRRRD